MLCSIGARGYLFRATKSGILKKIRPDRGKPVFHVYLYMNTGKMEYENKKYILRKLMQGTLTEQERIALHGSCEVERRMSEQWHTAPDAAGEDHPDERRIWRKVCRQSWEDIAAKEVLFYKIYGWVASVLLILGITGAVFYFSSGKSPAPMYVVSSGIRNMESVLLPDGTNVQLGPGSRLTYPGRFRGKKREVVLSGQAFFDVAKDPGKAFIVHTSGMDVQALGTAFELFCYEVENRSEAVLLHGKIKVGVTDEKTGKRMEYQVSPDQKLIVDKQNGQVSKWQVDADKYTAWRKQRILSFENEKLSMIIPRLEQWYGRKIMCQKDLAEKYRFTFKVRDEALDRILFMIGESSPLKYTSMDNGNYIVYK